MSSKKMGRPTSDKKTERIEIRLTESQSAAIQRCAESLKVTKTEVINMGVELVEKKLGLKK